MPAAEAEERAQLAHQTHAEADAHEEHAREIDPDADDRAVDTNGHSTDEQPAHRTV